MPPPAKGPSVSGVPGGAQDPRRGTRKPENLSPIPQLSFEELYTSYVKGLLTHDRALSRSSFEQWLQANDDLRVLYEDLVRRALYEVGDLWERGQISVATEHLATSVSESLLNLTYPRLFSAPRIGKTAVVASTANESHQIGARMVADFFELHGWRGYFLGANTPRQVLLDFLREKRPDTVALSLTVSVNLESLLETAVAIRREFPTLPILVGGQALRRGGRERLESLSRVHCLTSLSELEEWIRDAG